MGTYLKLTLTALFWGGTFVAARIVSQHNIGPFTASFIRFTTASMFLVAVALIRGIKIPVLAKHQIIPAVILGLTGVFSYNVFFFTGLQSITAGRASLIIAINPVLISILSDFFFREKMHTAKLIGAFLCLVGVILVISHGNVRSLFSGSAGRGEFFLFGCVVSWVTYSLVGKFVMKDLSALTAVLYSCAIGAFALFPFTFMENITGKIGAFDCVDWVALIYLAFFGTTLGFHWYYEGIVSIGAARAAVFINLVPVAGVFLGWLLLGESVNKSIIMGAILVVSGVYLTNRPRQIVKKTVAF
jgi:drug/metabolite transporter (DMT)-like permease